MWKKAFKTAIAGGVVLSMATLAACGGNSNGPSEGSAGDNGGAAGSNGEQVTVTLSVMTSNRFLELAKQKFEEKFPNIRIEIKETVAAPPTDGKMMVKKSGEKADSLNMEKFVSTVNTELMSGKASDIIVTDGSFPYKKYADKKLLENLNELMKNDPSFKRDDYYTNVFDAMLYKDGIYALPAKISLNMLAANPDSLKNVSFDDTKWTLNDFKDTVAPLAKDADSNGVPDAYVLAGMDGPALLSAFVNTSYAKLVDPSAKKFNTQSFTDMLKLSKSMIDSKLVTSERVDRGNVLFRSFRPEGYDEYALMLQAEFQNGNGKPYYMPSENDKRGLSFSTDTLFSINAKSAHKKEAWQFIAFMLSEEMQKTRELFGFAVNKKASQAWLEQMKEIGTGNGKNQMRLMGKDGKEIQLKAPDQKVIDELAAHLNSISFYAENDPKVIAIIEQEVAPFFAGQKSAEETAKTVQNKVNTYLQE